MYKSFLASIYHLTNPQFNLEFLCMKLLITAICVIIILILNTFFLTCCKF